MADEEASSNLRAIIDKVRAQVEECGLTEVIIVDDQLDTDLTESRWTEAVSYLQKEDNTGYEKLKKFLASKGSAKVDLLPQDDIQDEAVEIIKASASSSAKKTISEAKYKEKALEFLVGILHDVGLTTCCRSQVTEADPPRNGKLYFLDYRMRGDESTAGLDASNLLKDIVQKRLTETPPAAVLMSRGQNNRPEQADWEQVAQKAGYYRFNFRYLGKEKLQGDKMPVLFFLHELLSSLPLGKEYYTQLKKLKEAADTASEAALAKIRQLSPTEFSIFAGKHLGDGSGRRAARHVLELFLGLLDAEVKNSVSLELSFQTFASMLQSSPMLATTDVDSHTLHNLHTHLLYDLSQWILKGPVEFGDIYKGSEADVYYLVLTPECDLELRFNPKTNKWAPKAEDVLLLRGEVKNEPPNKTGGDVLGKPFLCKDVSRWIWWMMRNRVIVMVDELHSEPLAAVEPQVLTVQPTEAVASSDNPCYKKWGRLRQLDAEEIQQRFVSDLASVGTEQVSGKARSIPFEVWYCQRGQF